MATISEDYVSFETALLLKKKGFEQVGCQKQYNTQGDLCVGYCYGPVAPTLQMAMKWLREAHNIYIVISPISGKGYGAILCDVGDFDDFNYIGETDYFFHPEEAVEAAIKYSLKNLI